MNVTEKSIFEAQFQVSKPKNTQVFHNKAKKIVK